MKFYLDSSDIKQAKRWLSIIDGMTTNPVILEKEGGDVYRLATLIYPRPISVEICGDYYNSALDLRDRIPTVVVKIPLINGDRTDNIDVIHRLVEQGVKINCTALLSLPQVMIAERLKVSYVSVFGGRVEDEGGEHYETIKNCATYLWQQRLFNPTEGTELIVGSVRTVGHVINSAKAGADIVTVPPPILEKMFMHEKSLATVIEFEEANKRQHER